MGIPKSRLLNNSELSRKLQSIVLESGLATSPQIELLGEKWLCLVLCCTGGYPLQMAVPELVPIYRFCSAYSSCVVRYHGVLDLSTYSHRQLYASGLGFFYIVEICENFKTTF